MSNDIQQLQPELDNFIKLALKEDIGEGDHSSLACIPSDKRGEAVLKVKDKGVLAGVSLAEYIFTTVAEDCKVCISIQDGTQVKKGEEAFTVEGRIQDILKLERLVLNCMQRMSGIATQTNEMVSIIADLPCKLLDTRKTTPLIRFLEKWAVRIGGGHNHRFGLYDMIMLKDNHIDGSGGIEKAIKAVHEYQRSKGLSLAIEVETRNMDEVKEVVAIGGITRIMLDNFNSAHIREAVDFIGGRYETEASGGITKENLREYALTGVDFISTSQITHSVKSLDLSLKLV